MTKPAQTNFAKGMEAEELAAQFMRERGFKILHRRYKTPYGEIDLIAQKGAQISFVEVKTRQTREEALYSITPRAQKRITQAAQHFLSATPQANECDLQFDVIAISAPFDILYLDNAWVTSS